MTLIAVVYANVMFRAATPGSAARIWRSMTGLGTWQLQLAEWINNGFVVVLVAVGGLVFLMPNSQQFVGTLTLRGTGANGAMSPATQFAGAGVHLRLDLSLRVSRYFSASRSSNAGKLSFCTSISKCAKSSARAPVRSFEPEFSGRRMKVETSKTSSLATLEDLR